MPVVTNYIVIDTLTYNTLVDQLKNKSDASGQHSADTEQEKLLVKENKSDASGQQDNRIIRLEDLVNSILEKVKQGVRRVLNQMMTNEDEVVVCRDEVVVCRKLQDDELERAFVKNDHSLEELENLVNYIKEKQKQGYEINRLYIHRLMLDEMSEEDGLENILGKLFSLLEPFQNISIKFFSASPGPIVYGLKKIVRYPLEYLVENTYPEEVTRDQAQAIAMKYIKFFSPEPMVDDREKIAKDPMKYLVEKTGVSRDQARAITTRYLVAKTYPETMFEKGWSLCDDE